MKRPAPDGGIVTGALLAGAGYLLPWFRLDEDVQWWFSGYRYLAEGAGWTLWLPVFLIGAFAAALWAGESHGAAMTATVAGVAATFFAATVVALSLATYPENRGQDWATEMPFGIGLPVLAVGLGLLLTCAVRALLSTSLAPPPE